MEKINEHPTNLFNINRYQQINQFTKQNITLLIELQTETGRWKREY